MQALVLVGGFGTRLQPLTTDTPKPILDMVGRPFFSYMIDWLSSHGVDEVVLACGFLPGQIQAVLGDGAPGGPKLRYLVEPEPLGTAGAIKFAAPYLRDRFLALNGDSLADLDLTSLWQFHLEREARVSLGLYPMDDTSDFGLVGISSDGSVQNYTEKRQGAGHGLINAGAYVIESEVLDLIPEGRKVSIEHEVFPLLAGDGLYGMALDGYWKDIGTHDRYREACWDIIEGRVKTGARLNEQGIFVSPEANVADGAEIGPRAVIGPDCIVGSGARITNSVLLEGCQIGENAQIDGSIFSPGVTVAADVAVANMVLGRSEHIDA
ncbi:MAG: NDP-sugar synthase [Solirubrobacterales bacterium]